MAIRNFFLWAFVHIAIGFLAISNFGSFAPGKALTAALGINIAALQLILVHYQTKHPLEMVVGYQSMILTRAVDFVASISLFITLSTVAIMFMKLN